jgi:hypothetical protein
MRDREELNVPDSWPDKKFTDQCHTHDLERLMALADLEGDIQLAPAVRSKWLVVKDWDVDRRFTHGSIPANVSMFFDAINDPSDGVFPWLKARW